ncbi:MAG TPA: RNA-processing protein [Candidatus Aenigmarchaeota archaeon]|nr:RNA-processing protein [Candidatus Aenigmarchaeota archaeon]
MMQTVLIPEERKGVLIGKHGSVKERLERSTHTVIRINDCVEISGEGLDVMRAANVVKAIGRGFSPKVAFLLLDEEYVLEIISLEGETKNTIRRLMARVIGTRAASRRIIEESTHCYLSIYGKTVSVIGKSGDVERAVDAVELILSGKSHGYVYSRLRR